MAKYVVGDIQGCYKTFEKLLSEIDFNPSKDELWTTGDIVNRGAHSLEVLDWFYKNQDSIRLTLGNHDLQLIALHDKIRQPKKRDNLDLILKDKKAGKWINWLRQNPLFLEIDDHILIHAGILPQWNLPTLKEVAQIAQEYVSTRGFSKVVEFTKQLKSKKWDRDLKKRDLACIGLVSLTVLRFLEKDRETIDLKFKGPPRDAPKGLVPWYLLLHKDFSNKTIYFGHWASLGFFHHLNVTCIDSGCVWGDSLTAVNIDTKEVIQVPQEPKDKGVLF